jgi:hypothetical protein
MNDEQIAMFLPIIQLIGGGIRVNGRGVPDDP